LNLAAGSNALASSESRKSSFFRHMARPGDEIVAG